MKAIICVFSSLAFIACSRAHAADELGRWQEGVAGGLLVAESTSPDGGFALFEINAYDIGQPTTATAIAVADSQRIKLLGLIDSITQHSTDKPHKSFLTIKWSPDSHYLATHDSTPKHSVLHLYRITASAFRALPFPDLRHAAAARLNIPEQSIGSSGQMPIHWLHPNQLLVRVRLSMNHASRQIDLVISISQDETIAIRPDP